MRFAGGAIGVGSPTVRSLQVMALPCFVLFLCDLKEIERNRYPLVCCSTLMIFFPGPGNHAVKNRMSCRASLLKTHLQWLIMESLTLNAVYVGVHPRTLQPFTCCVSEITNSAVLD